MCLVIHQETMTETSDNLLELFFFAAKEDCMGCLSMIYQREYTPQLLCIVRIRFKRFRFEIIVKE